METKSRYEVIADLEQNKRDLMREHDNLADEFTAQEKDVKLKERQLEDTKIILQRQIDDAKEAVKNFQERLDERKATIKELIKSIDESLERLGKVASAPKS